MVYRRSIIAGASEDRLERLIQARLEPGADKTNIDARIWDLFGEEWCVMFTDLSGFSRGVAKFGIIHFLQTIYESERILIPIIEDHDGILLKVEGDSFLVIFRNVRKALQAAVHMQRVLKTYNADKVDEEKVLASVRRAASASCCVSVNRRVRRRAERGAHAGRPHARWELLVTGPEGRGGAIRK